MIKPDVVICTKDRPRHIVNMIKQVHDKIPYSQLIIVDGSREYSSLYELMPPFVKNLKVIHKPDVLLGNARQIGTGQCTSDTIIYFDDDLVIPWNWYSRMQDFYKSKPKDVAAVSSRVVRGSQVNDVIFKTFTNIHSHNVEGHSGGCVLIDRRRLLKAGGWNRKIHRGEDYELSLRLKEKGYRWVRNSLTFAYHPTTIMGLYRGMKENEKGAARITIDHGRLRRHLFKHIVELTVQPLRLTVRNKNIEVLPFYFFLRLFSLIGLMEGCHVEKG